MKLKNNLALIFSVVFLVGCAGMDTVSQYSSIKAEKVDVDGKCFSVQLKSGNQSALVDECPVAAASKAFFEGLTYGIVDTTQIGRAHV